ncbi:hypothetical protein BAC1_01591 [uncultured bacterium]|nr:hypothetical protein BAC1_01591 [uncultured bacterium]
MGTVWFKTGSGTIGANTPKQFLENLQTRELADGQLEAIKDLAAIPFDNHEGDLVPARSMEDYRAFLAKGWTPAKPSDFEYRMQILKNHI